MNKKKPSSKNSKRYKTKSLYVKGSTLNPQRETLSLTTLLSLYPPLHAVPSLNLPTGQIFKRSVCLFDLIHTFVFLPFVFYLKKTFTFYFLLCLYYFCLLSLRMAIEANLK